METTARAITIDEVSKLAGAPGTLGSGPYSTPKILATLYKEGVSGREVSQVIGQEPGMTAGVLRVANSPFYGQARSVSNIERAVVLLGLDAVRSTAAATCMRDAILRSTPSSTFDNKALLKHRVAAAVAAGALSRIAHPALAGEAFAAGLLHDLGASLLARLRPDGVKEVVDALRIDPTLDITALEEERMGVDHARSAAIVFETWRLPASLVAAVRHHHDPAAAPETDRALAALVHIGNHLSLVSGLGYPSEPASAAASPDAIALLRLSDEDLVSVTAMLPDQVLELQRALGF